MSKRKVKVVALVECLVEVQVLVEEHHLLNDERLRLIGLEKVCRGINGLKLRHVITLSEDEQAADEYVNLDVIDFTEKPGNATLNSIGLTEDINSIPKFVPLTHDCHDRLTLSGIKEVTLEKYYPRFTVKNWSSIYPNRDLPVPDSPWFVTKENSSSGFDSEYLHRNGEIYKQALREHNTGSAYYETKEDAINAINNYREKHR
jgi:hypothetical protein